MSIATERTQGLNTPSHEGLGGVMYEAQSLRGLVRATQWESVFGYRKREREDSKWEGLAEATPHHKQGRLGETRKSEDQNIRGGEHVRAKNNKTHQKRDSPRSRVDEMQTCESEGWNI